MKLRYIIGFWILALAGTSCSDENEAQPFFALDIQDLQMEAVGGSQDVKVTVPGEWTATASEPWVQVSPINGKSSEICTIKVDTTILANTDRTATVRFMTRNDADSRSLTITQKGFEKALTLSETSIKLSNFAENNKRTFDVEVISNVDFEVKIPDEATSWLSYEDYTFKLDAGARPRKTTIRFNWQGNTNPEARSAEVKFDVKETDMVKHDALVISQDRAPEITPDRTGDSLALVIIEQKLNVYINNRWDKSEALSNWRGVDLWDELDKGVTPEKMGRVRAVEFAQFHITKDEALPDELGYLTCLETLSLFSNGNKFLCSFDNEKANLKVLGKLTALKNLRIFSVGLIDLPEELKNLTELETLDLSGNNFQKLPDVLTPENFPKLKHLGLVNNRRSPSENLGNITYPDTEWGGFFGQTDILTRLFSWENLESLQLSNNIIQGSIPAMNQLPKWTREEVLANDTLKTAVNVLTRMPKVLPHCKDLRIGLNYLTGSLPQWLINHPWLRFWSPEVSIFKQCRELDKNGRKPGFGNVPKSFDYYYELYPLLKPEF